MTHDVSPDRPLRNATEAELRSALQKLLAAARSASEVLLDGAGYYLDGDGYEQPNTAQEEHGRLELAIDEAQYYLDGPEVDLDDPAERDRWDPDRDDRDGEFPVDHGDGQPDVRGL